MNLHELPLHMQRRLAALVIAATTGLVLVALSHHPVLASPGTASDILAQLAAQERPDGFIHGALILMLAMLAAAYSVFGGLLGATRPSVTLAASAYRLGCWLMVGAMLLDGFVTPQLARVYLGASAQDTALVLAVLRCISIAIQVLTKLGFLAMCVACLAWAYALLADRGHGRWAPWCAVSGVLAAVLPATVILASDIRLAPASLMALFAIHAVWNLLVAGLLFQAGKTRAGAAQPLQVPS